MNFPQNFIRKAIVTGAVFLGVLLLTGSVLAVPANPFPREVTQADGTVITIFGRGDEFFNWAEDEDGYIIAYDDESNNWCYALIDDAVIIPGSQVVGKNEKVRGRIKNDSLEPLIKKVNRNASREMSRRGGITSFSMESGLTPIAHTKNRQPLLVLLIEYNNRQFTTTYAANTTAYWSNHFFGTAGKTVNAYYSEVSAPFNLQFTKPTFTEADGFSVTNPITGVSSVQIIDGVARVKLNKNHPDTTVLGGVVRDDISLAFDAVKQYIDFSGISQVWNTILCEDFNITSVIAGYDDYYLSPHIWAHAMRQYWSPINGKERNISINYGTDPTGKLATYATQGELYYTDVPDPIGVSSHELGHVLGLRDLYSLIADGIGIGPCSLMASGSWGTDTSGDTMQGNTPTHLDAWSKAQLGFITPVTITSKEYWRNNVNSIAGNYNILQITNAAVDPAQYFMVENRQPIGFDRGLYGFKSIGYYVAGSGIMIYHVDERVYSGYYYDDDAGHWTGRPNDNNLHKFIDIEKYDPPSSINPFYILGGVFSAASTPNSNFHTAGHTSNPDGVHIDCHPQTLASDIYIKVNSASGNSMEVEVKPTLIINAYVDGGGGKILDESDNEVAGPVAVEYGDDIMLKFEPESGYELTSVTVNGTPYIPAAYIMLNVSTDCTVVAQFSWQATYTKINIGNSIDVYPAGVTFFGTLQKGTSSEPVSSFGFEVMGDGINPKPVSIEIPMDPDRVVFQENIGQFGVQLNFIGDALNQDIFWVRLFFTCGEDPVQYNDGGVWTKVEIIGEG